MEKRVEHVLYGLIAISVILPLRNLFTPLFGDETTYLAIAQSTISNGFYSLNGNPSSVTPIISYLLLVCSGFSVPITNISIAKLISYLCGLVGVLFFYKYLKLKKVDNMTRLALVLFVTSSPVFAAWIGTLYPEGFILMGFWTFIYYFNKDFSIRSWIFILLAGVLIVLARYVYAVLGLLVIGYLFLGLRTMESGLKRASFFKFMGFAVFIAIPLITWFYHVYIVESAPSSGLTYFNRFEEQSFFDRVKAGIGLIKAPNVSRVNGTPALANMFIPITGFRSWLLSIPLLILLIVGYTKEKAKKHRALCIALVLVLLGFVFSGTGFTRYWLALLPSFILGFYFCIPQTTHWQKIVLVASVCLALLYIANEIRITAMVLSN